jgi:ketosteroid isomerase-like protein/alkylhydroperoxidase/carboxymuconolactone decarboxylase family protein YurZ
MSGPSPTLATGRIGWGCTLACPQTLEEGTAMTNQHSVDDVIRTYFDAVQRGDQERIRASLAEDATFWIHGNLPISGTYEGRDAIVDGLFQGALSRFEPGSLTVELTSTFVSEDHAAAEWVSRARTPTGTQYENCCSGIFVVRDGVITSVREYMDTQADAESWRSVPGRSAGAPTKLRPAGMESMQGTGVDEALGYYWELFEDWFIPLFGQELPARSKLDRKTAELITVVLCAVRGAEASLHAHARMAIEHGATLDELRGVMLLTIPSMGIPAALEGLAMVESGFHASAGADAKEVAPDS